MGMGGTERYWEGMGGDWERIGAILGALELSWEHWEGLGFIPGGTGS